MISPVKIEFVSQITVDLIVVDLLTRFPVFEIGNTVRKIQRVVIESGVVSDPVGFIGGNPVIANSPLHLIGFRKTMITQQLIDNEHCCSGIHVTGEKRIRYLIHIELVSTSVPALFIDLICQFIYKQKIVVKLVVSVKTVGQVQQPGQIFIACPGSVSEKSE